MIVRAHHEPMLELTESELERVKANLPGRMINVAKLDVPLVKGQQWSRSRQIWVNV